MTVVNPTRGVELTGSTGSIAVYFDRANPAVNIGSGSIAVHLLSTGGTVWVRQDPDGTLGAIRTALPAGNNNIGDVDIVSGTLTSITNTVAVYFDRANPAVSANYGSGTFLVAFDRGNPAVNITSGTLTGITNSINVYLGGTAGTLGVRVGQIDGTVNIAFSPANPAVNITSIAAGDTNIGNVDVVTLPALVTGTANIGDVDIASGTLTNITNTVAVYFDRANPAVSVNYGSGTFFVAFDRANPSVSIGGASSSVGVYFDRGNPTVSMSDPFGTAIVFRTATGSASSAGNNTVVSPEASRNIKVFAYQLTTTAQVGIAPRFTTGASAGATELWRNALQAPSQGIAGANLAVTPPAYLFATGAGNTLALYLDSGSLVHYSVAYFKETA